MHDGSGGIAYEGWNMRHVDVVLSREVGLAVGVGLGSHIKSENIRADQVCLQ